MHPPTHAPQDKKLAELPLYKALLTTFNSSEIIRWAAFQLQHKEEFAAQAEVFSGARRGQRVQGRPCGLWGRWGHGESRMLRLLSHGP